MLTKMQQNRLNIQNSHGFISMTRLPLVLILTFVSFDVVCEEISKKRLDGMISKV